MDAIQNTLRAIVSATGLIVILAPVVSVLLKVRRERGRSIGTGSSLRRWPAVVLIMVGFLATGVILWKPLHLPLPILIQYVLSWIGFLIVMPAISLYLWGLMTLGKYFGVSSAAGADLYADHQLIQNGPYRFVRHPMYLGVVLTAIGAFLVFRTWAMLIFLPMSTVVIRRASQEEKLLEFELGEEWRSYVQRVPMWIPRRFWKNNVKHT
jgi:protein-S-isoprenylcysteine O-methyltransferase Ste14